MLAIERIMDERGHQQAWLAERMGIHQSYLSKLLAGERRWTPELKQKAAAALALPADVLFLPVSVVAADGNGSDA